MSERRDAEGVSMTQRDESVATALELIEICDDPLDFLERKIEEAESYRDGELVTKWLRVRRAVQELLQQSGSSGGDPGGSEQ